MNPITKFILDLQNAIYSNVKAIKFDGSPASRTVMALYATIFEQTESCMLLLKAGKVAGVEVIQRSNLEAIAHLTNLIRDPEYLDVMHANHLTQKLSLLKEGLAGQNAYLAGLGQSIDATQKQMELEQNLAALKAKGIHPKNTFQRFELADMADIYRSAYNMMSGSSHQDIGTLVRRHFEETDGDVHIHLHTLSNRDDHELILDSLAGILNNANLMVHMHFCTESVALFDDMDQQLLVLRSQRNR